MNHNYLESTQICYLSINKEMKMPELRSNGRQHSSLFVEKRSLLRKNLREPLKCKKNIVNANGSIRKSNNAKSSSAESNKLTKLSKQQTHEMLPCSVVIDVLSGMSETVPWSSPKRALRSSSRQKIALHTKEVTVVDKTVPQFKFEKQNVLVEKTQNISHISSVPPNKKKRPSFYRNSLPTQSNPKSHGQNELFHNTVTGVFKGSQVSPDETVRSRRSSMRLRSQESPKNNSDKIKLSVDIDVLSGMSETVPWKSPKRALRSSLRQKIALHSKEVTVADKTVSQFKFKKQQNVFDEKTPNISHVSSVPPNKKKIPSFYRNSLPTQCNPKSHGQDELSHNTVTGVFKCSQVSPDKTVRSRRSSMRLQSQESPKNNSDRIRLSVDPESKNRNSAIITKQQKAEQQVSVHRRSKSKESFAQNQKKKQPIIKKRCLRKSSGKLKMLARPKSFSGSIPVDALSLTPFHKRETKSDGFKFPGRNTLKRKRFVIDALKKVDEHYEDDIYEEKEFDCFINVLPDDTTESEMSYSISTPKLGFQLTPVIHSKTPVYKDCFSPSEYALSRKVAEEYIYRNKKRKSKPVETPQVPEKKKLEFNDIVESACKAQKRVEKLFEDESDCEDNYFSDVI